MYQITVPLTIWNDLLNDFFLNGLGKRWNTQPMGIVISLMQLNLNKKCNMGITQVTFSTMHYQKGRVLIKNGGRPLTMVKETIITGEGCG